MQEFEKVRNKKSNFLISPLKHVVGIQKTHLIETILLSTQTYVKTDGSENI